MKRVVVTGARGFIGRRAIAPLLAAGYEVHALSSSATAVAGAPSDVAWHVVDLFDVTQVAPTLARVRPTHLLHLAWETTPGSYWTSPENLGWVRASLALAEAFVRAGGQRFVAAGTCAEYDWRYGYCTEGLTPTTPVTLYGAAKHATQSVIAAYAATASLSWAWGRVFFLYGPDEPVPRLVPSVARALVRGDPAACSHGRQVRDFLHVQDVADAFVALLGSDVSGAVNIGSGEPVTIARVVELLASAARRPDLVRLGALPARADEPPVLVPDVKRLRTEVGWAPKYTLERGLEETLAFWRERRDLAREA